MNNRLCGWCITDLVRPSFLADRAADCPGCAQHRAYKEAVAKATDCKLNPYHLCNDCAPGKPCKCACHDARLGHLPRAEVVTPKPKLLLKKRKPNVHRKAVQG